MNYEGTVVAFKGAYGFVFSEKLARRVFFHVSEFHGVDPKAGDRVLFELSPSKTLGKPDAATNVRPQEGVL